MTEEELLEDIEREVREFAAKIKTETPKTTGIPTPPKITSVESSFGKTRIMTNINKPGGKTRA